MNPLVEKMLNATVSNDVETRFLEDLFEHEAKCESAHTETTCSFKVTHAVKTCGGDWIICHASASRMIQDSRSHTHCPCGEFIEKCWTIRPI